MRCGLSAAIRDVPICLEITLPGSSRAVWMSIPPKSEQTSLLSLTCPPDRYIVSRVVRGTQPTPLKLLPRVGAHKLITIMCSGCVLIGFEVQYQGILFCTRYGRSAFRTANPFWARSACKWSEPCFFIPPSLLCLLFVQLPRRAPSRHCRDARVYGHTTTPCMIRGIESTPPRAFFCDW